MWVKITSYPFDIAQTPGCAKYSLPAFGEGKPWVVRHIVPVEPVWEMQFPVGLELRSILSVKGELHHWRDDNIAHHNGATAIVRVNMNDVMAAAELLKDRIDHFQSKGRHYAVQAVELDYHDSEAPEHFIAGVDQYGILRALDIHLKHPVAGMLGLDIATECI